uniref:Uncharacterized protein n=1 Tax=Anguilla anguilla TaxID=7936 RepID=A0A0E9XWJ0_ANGAN
MQPMPSTGIAKECI